MLANVIRLLGRPGTILGLIALAVAGASFAIAANPSADGTVTACVNKKTKVIRLASAKGRCKARERKLSWNQRGVPGAPGQNGAPGQDGADGQNGAAGTPAAATARDTRPAEVTTSSSTDVADDVPSVTVEVPAGGATVLLGAAFDGKVGIGDAAARFYDGETPLGEVGASHTVTYSHVTGSYVQFADAGSHTYTLRYSSTSGAHVATFKDLSLSVGVLR